MRRQALSSQAFAELSGRAERPDPYRLPARFATVLHGGAPGQTVRVMIDRDRVTIAGDGRIVTLPLRQYHGVAVRVEARADGAGAGPDLAAILELRHADPRLSVTLATAADPAEIVADWQAWSRVLALPMHLVEADGSLTEPIPHLGGVRIERQAPRRRHSYFAARRPRFLVRRKTGWARGTVRVKGEEIIARD